MNERDLDEFLNEPGDLFVRQCEELWHEMWEISNDGEHSMALRTTAEAVSRYLELPRLYDKASVAEQREIDPMLMTVWTAITESPGDYSHVPAGSNSAAVDQTAQCARGLMDALDGLGGLSIEENLLVALSLKVCADMAWQLPKPPDSRQPKLE